MSKTQIPDQLAERLNALMRPADDVPWDAFAQGLLAAIVEERDPVAALAYVFENKSFAHWSGPRTLAGDYPQPLDTKPGGRDHADAEAFKSDPKIRLRYEVVVARIRAEEPDARERAERALAFLESVKTRFGRAFVLDEMLKDKAFVSAATLPTTVRFDEEIPPEEFRAILWRNRTVIAALEGTVTSDTITHKASLGAAVLDAVAAISDERERAAILGHFLNPCLYGSGIEVKALKLDLGGLGDLFEQIREAEEQGKPCPMCSTVHKRGEGHEEHKE